ncbi:MAG: CoA-binding protein [Bacteroidota bacterium]|nr:CoA-binding protein [Bacteroidota bacterium]
MNKPTVVIGASDNPERYAHKAVLSLQKHGYVVHAVGLKKGTINGIEIHSDRPTFENIDTVTLYVGPANQSFWYDYVLSLKPKRIIFNPGTENSEFESLAQKQGIETIEACTLVMLSVGTY